MTTGSNLHTRGQVYYIRLKVSAELQNLMGTVELSRSLNTKDGRTANVRKLYVLAEWHECFEDSAAAARHHRIRLRKRDVGPPRSRASPG